MVENVTTFHALPDPYKDRVVPEQTCPALINRPMPDSLLFQNDVPNWKALREF